MQTIEKDRYAILRSKYRQAIATKETEIERLREKLELVDELESDANTLPACGIHSSPESKYDGWTVTKAALDAVQTIGTNGGVTAPEVRNHISAHGFKSTGKYFPSTVVLTLKRLAASGKIITSKVDDRRVYKVKM